MPLNGEQGAQHSHGGHCWGRYGAEHGSEDYPSGLFSPVFNPPCVTCPVCLESNYGWGLTVQEAEEMTQAEWERFAVLRGWIPDVHKL